GRINVIIEPLVIDGPAVSIRKFRKDPLTPEALLQLGTFDLAIAQLLEMAVRARCNILISGGTSSGQTSLRNALAHCVPTDERGAEVTEMLQAMNTGHDGSMGTIHASSPRECLYRLEMLAGFAGFQGSEISLRRQVANAIDFIVQIARLPNGSRRIVSITEIT